MEDIMVGHQFWEGCCTSCLRYHVRSGGPVERQVYICDNCEGGWLTFYPIDWSTWSQRLEDGALKVLA